MRFAQGEAPGGKGEEPAASLSSPDDSKSLGKRKGVVWGGNWATGHASPKSKLLVSEGCLLFWCTCAQEFSESIGNEIVFRRLFGTVAMYA